ncbi:hypothetical protein L7F22_031721 [Adiantum nelumboides]|nr:hypothetical protein [Adiantum nelumboides]
MRQSCLKMLHMLILTRTIKFRSLVPPIVVEKEPHGALPQAEFENQPVNLEPEEVGQEIHAPNEDGQPPHRYDPSLHHIMLSYEGEPLTYKEAKSCELSSKWELAMQEEIKFLYANDTWDLVPLPKGRKALPNKWVYKVKSVDGKPKYKARLVAKGYAQKEGIDFQEVFSPVVKMTTLRVLFTLTAVLDLKLYQMDVKTAFSHGDIDEEIYMKQPEGFVVPGKERLVCKLKRSLYGLKQAPRQCKYYFKCGDSALSSMSKEGWFKTLPYPSPANYPSKIAVVGDLGMTYNSSSTLDHVMRNEPSLLLMVGDLSYANQYVTTGMKGASCYSCEFPNSPTRETYQPHWDAWGRFMEPLVSTVPMMVIEGNHEIESQAENVQFASYNARFAAPHQESGSGSKLFYSFDAGGIHFIMLGGYVDYNRTGEQYIWLRKDLEKVNRSVTPWLIAAWHPPWYNSYRSHYREVECMRLAMEDLLYENGVDAVFSGHVHAYERCNRLYNYELNPCGPIYITVGDGGNIEKVDVVHADDDGQCPTPLDSIPEFGEICPFDFTTGPAAGKYCWDTQPEWSAFREGSFGHGILEVLNATHALWTWHRNQDFGQAEHGGDQIYIVRTPDVCPNLHTKK